MADDKSGADDFKKGLKELGNQAFGWWLGAGGMALICSGIFGAVTGDRKGQQRMQDEAFDKHRQDLRKNLGAGK